jgi:hypothetical protein
VILPDKLLGPARSGGRLYRDLAEAQSDRGAPYRLESWLAGQVAGDEPSRSERTLRVYAAHPVGDVAGVSCGSSGEREGLVWHWDAQLRIQ